MKRLISFALLAVIATSLVVLSGVISIKASSGHWAATAWFLDLVKRRSVSTRSLGIDVPPLDAASLVTKGAAHYEAGCRQCHGSPNAPLPVIPARMTPHPPDLQAQVSRWKPRELFYIVKHGIKFTGMPAWPSPHRDDEVWAVVAFLQVLPGMDSAAYMRLAFGDRGPGMSGSQPQGVDDSSAVSRVARESCARCHGVDSQGRDVSAFPRLAGQRPEYLTRALHAYARGARHSGIMAPIASELNEETMRNLAEYYGGLAPRTEAGKTASAVRGAEIAANGIPAERVPACSECHGPAPRRRNPAYPILAGQFAEYLVLQLRLFAADQRGGSEYADIMRPIAGRLTPAQMDDVAAYYASLPQREAR